jgi:hypothetical protein
LISVILLVISPIALNIVGNLVEKIIIVDDWDLKNKLL